MNLNVCFVLPRLPIGRSGVLVGGAATNCVSLALELRRQGVHIELISPVLKEYMGTLATHPMSEIVRPVPIRGFGLVGRGVSALWSLRKSVRARMREMNYDVVHSHSGTFPYALAALAVDREQCVRLHSLYCPLGAEGGVYGSWWENPTLVRILFNRLDKVVAVTENVYGSVKRAGVPESQLHHIPMSVDTRRFSPGTDEQENAYFLKDHDTIRVLFVGNASKEKGLIQLLDAVGGLIEKGLALNLVATIENQSRIQRYSDREEHAKQRIRELGITRHVRLLGLVEDVRTLYSEADIVVIPWVTSRGPSDYPMVALEAMAMGKCVVSTPVGGCSELLRDGNAGILTQDFSAEGIANAVEFAATHPEVRRQVGQAALAASQRFSVEAAGKQMIDLYEHLLLEKQSNPP